MAIELAYMNLVIPIRNIEKYYPGGFEQYKKDNEGKMEHDDYLVMKSAMTMEEIESFAKECEEFGLIGVIEKQGVKYWQDFCIVDIIPTLPCEWLEHDGTAVYHIEDQAYIAELEALPIEDRIIQILYIHGYGGEGNSRTAQALATALPENYYIFEPCFPLNSNELNPDKALELAKKTIQRRGINIVIASSLGAFTALQLRDIPKILINPCLYPSKELPKRVDVPEDILSDFSEIEKRTFENINDKEKTHTFGVFSINDELFSYKEEFSKHYSNIQIMEDTHRISVENVEKVIVPIVQDITKYSAVF